MPFEIDQNWTFQFSSLNFHLLNKLSMFGHPFFFLSGLTPSPAIVKWFVRASHIYTAPNREMAFFPTCVQNITNFILYPNLHFIIDDRELTTASH